MNTDIKKVLSETESILYFAVSAIRLSVIAADLDFDRNCLEIINTLQTIAEMVEKSRESITNTLLLLNYQP